MSVNVWFKQEEREDTITRILKVGVTSLCKRPNFIKSIFLFSDIFCQKFPANLDGVISQNNKTGILMIMDTKIQSISF